ncbi:hypothetical protein SASPL_135590 [Salvia splendens]|uniref:X8 domain-containing protein n=1 Tax=Salvia splendens TaxID=180675 RepID=A0A8X8WZ08_SALSN|nr:hypothetical protein SASPL_135590 [Salvia splendens]
MAPNPTATSAACCIANPSASQTALQVALDYACGYGGTDCSAIQPSRECWDPNTLVMAAVASQRLPTPPQRLYPPQRHIHPPPWSYHNLAPQQPLILTYRAGIMGTETMGQPGGDNGDGDYGPTGEPNQAGTARSSPVLLITCLVMPHSMARHI